ncbi:hypothetical protein [Boudabousia marimammalium]|uniref:hypothetical protein n=1 Tax=Boudabousia marimammalium TaxID=156892 RepID=UPI001178B89C|nr:hypothetical protein [Boudabousia marimammalium]
MEQVDLGTVRYVFEAGIDSRYLPLPLPEPSLLLFVHEDDSVQVVKKADMWLDSMSWTDKGLFYADEDNDYFYEGGKLTTIPAKKAAFADALVELDDRSTRVGLYNRGFSEDGGYREDVYVSTPQGNQLGNAGAPMSMVGICDNSVYGVSLENDSQYREYLQLKLIVKDKIPQTKLLAKAYPLGTSLYGSDESIPCVDNQLLFISTDSIDPEETPNFKLPDMKDSLPTIKLGGAKFDGDYADLFTSVDELGHRVFSTLEKWDVQTGERLVIPLVDKAGKQLTWSPGSFRQGKHSLLGRELYWFDRGLLVKTNIDSGVTEIVNDELKGLKNNWIVDRFKDGKFIVYVERLDEGGSDLVYTFDLLSGSLVHKKDVTFLRKYLGDKSIAGIEIPPGEK